MEIKCSMCGDTFEAKGFNAKYCPECAAIRKKQQDHSAWIKRKGQKMIKEDTNSKMAKVEQLEKKHAAVLGISRLYYTLWKSENPKEYKKWISEHMNDK